MSAGTSTARKQFNTSGFLNNWCGLLFPVVPHKGKSLANAGREAGLREWLEGLAKSANERNARMGRWYLRQLSEAAKAPVFVAWDSAGGVEDASVAGSGRKKCSAAMPLRLAV